MTWLRGFARKKAGASIGHGYLVAREYQIEMAVRAHRLLRSGKNALIDLPTGSGKTQVAVLLCLLQSRHSQGCTLYIVPNRTLVAQVTEFASWVNPELPVAPLQEEDAYNAFRWRALRQANHVIISTPGLLASRLRRDADSTFRSRVTALIIDEFDEFLLLEPVQETYRARCDVDFERLLLFFTKTPLVLMSGTAPSAASPRLHSPSASYLAKYVTSRFAPTRLTVPEDRIRRYIPQAIVMLTPCTDQRVTECHRALSHTLQSRFERFECEEHGPALDIGAFLDRLDGIVMRTVTIARLRDGGTVRVDRRVRDFARSLLPLRTKYQFLYEDLFAGIQAEWTKKPILENCTPTGDWADVLRLRDTRPDKTYQAALGAKATMLLSIIGDHRNERGLVFTRYVRTSNALAAYLVGQGVTTTEINGEIPGPLRYQRLDTFASRNDGVLLITRSTGRRGLDVPFADYAVLYSPKSDEYVVWQELSRIRGTLGAEKPSYILYYDGTSEEQRAKSLREDMAASKHHRYKFITEGTTLRT